MSAGAGPPTGLGSLLPSRAGRCCLGVLLLILVRPLPVRASATVVWKLGEPDRSDHEFSAWPNPRSDREVVVRVGGGTELRRWPKFHPGSGNGAFGGRPYRFTLVFDLPGSPPTGVFYLDLSLLFRQPRVPVLELDINGHRGRYYFHPDPMFDLGSVSDEFNPIRSAARRSLPLRADFFRPGENRLTFVALDVPQQIIRNRNVGGSGDSGFFYDALALTHDPEARLDTKPRVTLIPTVLFPKTDRGVQEECRLIVAFPPGWAAGMARIRLPNFSAEIALPKAPEFGEERLGFLVPGDARPGKGQVTFRAGPPRLPPATPDRPEAERQAAGWGMDQTVAVDFVPARKWKVFYAPNEHLDIGYTDYRAKVAEVHSRNVDRLLDVLEAHPDYRFNFDGSWILEQWLATRSTQQVKRFAAEAKAGRIGVNGFYDSFVTDYPALETFIRSLYFSKELQKRYGVPFDFAHITDIPGNSWAVPSVLAAAGIHYFADGGNQDRGPLIVYGHWSVRSPFWWEGPDGRRVLTWFSSHYHQFKAVFGLPPTLADGRGGLRRFLRTYAQSGYRPDAVLLYGTEVENLPAEFDDAKFVGRWNAVFAYPRLIPCRFSQFFQYIEKRYAAALPVVRGAAGAYWGDNFGAFAWATARDRANQMRVVSAETLGALTTALNPLLRFPRQWDHAVWRDILLYSEHTFGSHRTAAQPEHDEVIGQLREKEAQTLRAQNGIDKLMRHGMSQLADLIQTEGRNLIVFNPSSWKRSGLVRFMVDNGATLTDVAQGRQVDYQVIASKDGAQTIRFLAADVPPLGYKVYRLGREATRPVTPFGPSPRPDPVIENRFYRVTLDPARAAIRSIYDKDLGRELVDRTSPYRLNEYLFVTGGGTATGRGRGAEDSRLLHPYRWLPPARLTIHHPGHGTLLSVEKTPWGQEIRMTAAALHTPNIETEILLPNDRKRIEVRDTIQVDLLYAKQAAYFAFPWAVTGPVFHCEIANGFLDPAKNLLEGACSDWFLVQDLVNVENGQTSINLAVVDSPLVCLSDIDRGRWSRRFRSRSSTVFSFVLNNYWSPKWAGRESVRLRNRYVITSGSRFRPAPATRFGREARQPLEIAELTASDKLPGKRGRLPPGEASLAQLEPDTLVITACKTAEDGRGSVVRVLETAGHEGDGLLRLPFLAVTSAHQANAVEVLGRALQTDAHGVHFHVRPHQMLTLRLTVRHRP